MSWARACKGAKEARGEFRISVFFEEDDAMGKLKKKQENSIHNKIKTKVGKRMNVEVCPWARGVPGDAFWSSASASAG
jgi:hypothetical protein